MLTIEKLCDMLDKLEVSPSMTAGYSMFRNMSLDYDDLKQIFELIYKEFSLGSESNMFIPHKPEEFKEMLLREVVTVSALPSYLNERYLEHLITKK